MSDKRDITVSILRFIFGAILGGVLTTLTVMTAIWFGDTKVINAIIMIGGAITFAVAISATIWGDRFLTGFMKMLRIFKYL